MLGGVFGVGLGVGVDKYLILFLSLLHEKINSREVSLFRSRLIGDSLILANNFKGLGIDAPLPPHIHIASSFQFLAPTHTITLFHPGLYPSHPPPSPTITLFPPTINMFPLPITIKKC